MPTNTAAWLTAKGGAVEVREAPVPTPGPGELVVRARAVAVNPVDWIVQFVGGVVYPWLRYPTVLGSDVTGEVVEVGAGVTRFRPGDRVLGHAVGLEKSRNSAAEGAFQEYPVLLERLTALILKDLAFERAAVVPLGLSTAACGLFQQHTLALPMPGASAAPPTGQVVLVWGGSTSVGVNAIQLAVAAGYEVIATASPRGFDELRRLGASDVIDRTSADVVAEVVAALRGRRLAGAIAIGKGSARPCIEIARRAGGRARVATASPSVSLESLAEPRGRRRRMVPLFARLVAGQVAQTLAARRAGVHVGAIWGGSLKDDEVGPGMYGGFLPAALADGRFVPAPEPRVVGSGLGMIADALAEQHRGVSARKIVVTLPGA